MQYKCNKKYSLFKIEAYSYIVLIDNREESTE